MEKLLFAAGTSFLRAFGAAMLTFSVGVLSAPDLNTAAALGLSALLASLAMGFRAVQVFIPLLSFASIVKNKVVASWLDAFTRAALAAFVISITGWLDSPNYEGWKSIAIGVITGALTAGFRALQGLLTPGDGPAPAFGLGKGSG